MKSALIPLTRRLGVATTIMSKERIQPSPAAVTIKPSQKMPNATIAGGALNTAAGVGAVVLGGQQNYATHDYSKVSGQGAVTRNIHSDVDGAMFANLGDAQRAHYTIVGQSGGEALTVALGPEVPVSGAIAFSALISAKQFGNASAGFEIKGVIRNYGGTVALVSGGIINTLGNEIDFASGVLPPVSPNVSGNQLAFVLSGVRGGTVRWVISLETAEVVY